MNEADVVSLGEKLIHIMTDREACHSLVRKGRLEIQDHLQARTPLSTETDVYAVLLVRALRKWEFCEELYASGVDPRDPYYRRAWNDYDSAFDLLWVTPNQPGEPATEEAFSSLGCIWDVIHP